MEETDTSATTEKSLGIKRLSGNLLKIFREEYIPIQRTQACKQRDAEVLIDITKYYTALSLDGND